MKAGTARQADTFGQVSSPSGPGYLPPFLVGRDGALARLRGLTVAGRESEQNLAFAGLHQLLRPVVDRVPELPERQAKALSGAFALSSDPVPPDALLTGITVLTLLSGLAGEEALLVVADDAQWLDRGSLNALPAPRPAPAGWRA